MKVLAKPIVLDRSALLARYRDNRKRSNMLFAIVRDAMYERPLELRHPFVFYLGHIPAFHYNTLAKRAFGRPSLNEHFDTLFRRGIDPDSIEAAQDAQAVWPSVAEVEAYAARIDATIESLILHERLDDDANPYLRRAEALFTVLEHEEMHQETLVYIINRLDASRKRLEHWLPGPARPTQSVSRRIAVPAGRVRLGARRDEIDFGWDNEFDTVEHAVAQFAVDALPVTNGEYLAFVEQGGPAPAQWLRTGETWMLRTMYGAVPLPLAWPVYTSLDDAEAYAHRKNARIMTEAEYHRAAFGDPSGVERRMPWGDAPPAAEHGNFGFRRFDPEPAGASPLGASAWGVEELVGNGWEWTSTPFEPLPGLEPMASYPEYSADFFDGKHAVLKGASPVTCDGLLRRSLRNWFRSDYPYAYAKFRLAYDIG